MKKRDKNGAKGNEIAVKKVERNRKKNFSVNEIFVVTGSVHKNLEIIQSKLTKSITNKRKTETWGEITSNNRVSANYIISRIQLIYPVAAIYPEPVLTNFI